MEIKEENINRFIFAMFNMMQGFKEGMEECSASSGGLSEKEFVLITTVGQKQSAKMSEIAEGLNAPLSTVTSLVDKLVERKYLERYNSSEDRRVVLVTLATLGKQTFNSFLTFKTDIAKKILSNFPESEQNILINYLEKIPPILQTKK